jgi:hypothetical protein
LIETNAIGTLDVVQRIARLMRDCGEGRLDPGRPSGGLPISADYRDRFEALSGQSLWECPHCHIGIMVVVDCVARPKVCQAVPDTS